MTLRINLAQPDFHALKEHLYTCSNHTDADCLPQCVIINSNRHTHLVSVVTTKTKQTYCCPQYHDRGSCAAQHRQSTLELGRPSKLTVEEGGCVSGSSSQTPPVDYFDAGPSHLRRSNTGGPVNILPPRHFTNATTTAKPAATHTFEELVEQHQQAGIEPSQVESIPAGTCDLHPWIWISGSQMLPWMWVEPPEIEIPTVVPPQMRTVAGIGPLLLHQCMPLDIADSTAMTTQPPSPQHHPQQQTFTPSYLWTRKEYLNASYTRGAVYLVTELGTRESWTHSSIRENSGAYFNFIPPTKY
ncbi:hypothetical protein K439DRAFT_1614316 [Ramaria rubella]|nr:hypothetical protein K439DRAFT_1614316 [Ramaria rubella]